jgi:hypothetical protein
MKYAHITLLIYHLFSGILLGQTDSVYTIQDTACKSENYDRIYKLFLEDREGEIKHLWKVNLLQFALIEPNIRFEQKLSKRNSIESHLRLRFPVKQVALIFPLDYEGFNNVRFRTTFQQDVKFYHNVNSRIRKGKSVNGFSGNYIAANFMASYATYEFEEIDARFSFGLGFTYGLQRRIGNIGYMGAHAGIYRIYSPQPIYYGNELSWDYIFNIGLEAGFAIDSFKNLKRMLTR